MSAATATSVPAAAANASPAPRGLRFGFSTLGCPDLELTGVRTLAAKHRSRFIEIRTLGGSLNFVEPLAQFPGGAAGARDFLLEAGVRVRLVGSSFLLTRAPDAQRALLIAEAEVGEALGAKWLRVFGGGAWGEPLTAEAAAIARAHRAWWTRLRAARGWTIDLILEVHDAFSGSPQVLELFTQTGDPMPLLWDTHHTWKIAGETAAHSWSQLGAHVRHVHVKDSVAQAWDKLPYTYVAPGCGEFPLSATLDLLAEAGFEGVVSLEWEKQWHPSLAPLDTVLPAWNQATAAHRRPSPRSSTPHPTLLLKPDFDRTHIAPAAGPYFHGAREQYADIVSSGPTACTAGLGEPTPDFPRLGKFRVYYEGGDETQRFARIVTDDTDPQNRVLRFNLTEPNVTIRWPDGDQHKSRVQTELYGNIELRDFFLSVRLRFRPDVAKLKTYPGKIDWFTLMEFWNHAGWTDEPFPYRFGFHLVKPDPAPGTDLFFATASQHQVDAKTYKDVWHAENLAVPVPYGVWLKLEIHFEEGDADSGRFYAAVTPAGGKRTVLFDVRGFTHHPENPAPTGMKQLSPLKLYTSAEVVNFLRAQGSALELDWDDFEFWTGRAPEDVVR